VFLREITTTVQPVSRAYPPFCNMHRCNEFQRYLGYKVVSAKTIVKNAALMAKANLENTLWTHPLVRSYEPADLGVALVVLTAALFLCFTVDDWSRHRRRRWLRMDSPCESNVNLRHSHHL
jgi:hypothetical protein